MTYIDKDKIPYYLDTSEEAPMEGRKITFKSDIDKIPPADVEEVKHGEWKKVESGTICTNCYRVYDNGFEFSYKQIKEYFKRCPECGAKMDGGKADGR